LAVANLPNATGLSNYTVTYQDGSGNTLGTATGVGATVAGTAGTATIPLPGPIDLTIPGRMDAHICFGSNSTTPDTNIIKVAFTASNGNNAIGVVVSGSMTQMSIFIFNSNPANAYGFTGGIPSYTCGSMFFDWIGTGAGGLDAAGNQHSWAGWIPDTLTGLSLAPPAFQAAYQSVPVAVESTVIPANVAPVTSFYISDASANSIVTGVFVSQGRLDGPTDGQMPVPGYIAPVVLDDSTQNRTYPSNVWIPPNYGTPQGNGIVQIFHANASTNSVSNAGSIVFPNLFQAGYIVASVLGDTGNGYNNAISGCPAATGSAPYCSPTSTNWAGPTGAQYRNSFAGIIRQYLPNANQLFRFGMSMGALNALEDEMLHPGGAAIATFSPALNLTAAYTLSGSAPFGAYTNFAANINNGWGTWYQSLQGSNTGNNPATSPTFWQPVGNSFTGLALGYMSAPRFRNTGSYLSTRTYNQNDITALPYTGTIGALAAFDPNLNYPSFTNIPIQNWTEVQDSQVPTAWGANFIAGITSAGNPNATNNTLTDCIANAGQSCHLSQGVFTAGGTLTPPFNLTTNPSPTLTFFNRFNTPFPAIIGAPQPVQGTSGTTQTHNYAVATATAGATATAVNPCTAARCQITFTGGSVTTGPILTLAWPAGTFGIIPVCTATEQANTTPHGLGSPLSGTTLTGTTVNAAVTVAGASFTVVVACTQP
jgi:hypothetical protein